MSDQNVQTSRPSISQEDKVAYAYKTQKILSKAWQDLKINRSGMRAEFRRWRPDSTKEPTNDMRRHVWGWIGTPLRPESDTSSSDKSVEATEKANEPAPQSDSHQERYRKELELEVIDKAATVTAMRAAAGDHPPQASIGEALYKAGMNDLRLSRLLTEPKSSRIDSLQRAMKFLDAHQIGVKWEYAETRNIMDYLFGTDRMAQRAANAWAADFFRARGRTEKPEAGDTTDESSDTE